MTDPFAALSPKLFAIAYRMLGSATEAEDVVQDAYLRWQTVDQAAVESAEAFLRAIVVRLCLDALKSAQARRETYPGIWLPEPIRTEIPAEFTDPGEQVSEAESVSMAFMLLLESLSPDERAVFLLREVFDYAYDEIATLLEKSNEACRQLFSRAKKHVADHRQRFQPSPEQHRQLLAQFLQAVQNGDMVGLTALLAEDAVSYSDGGGKALAALRPVFGREALAQLILRLARTFTAETRLEVAVLNGQEALIFREGDKIETVLAFRTTPESIEALYFVRNPDKLTHLYKSRGRPSA